VHEYVTWGAKLAGVPSDVARASAEAALDKMALGPSAKSKLALLTPTLRRSVVVASALATGAEVIAVEDPLGGLSDEVADAYAGVLAAALADRASVVFAPRMPLASPLARAADEAISLTPFRVEGQGPPAELALEQRRFVTRFAGPVDAIVEPLAARGARLSPHGVHLSLDLGPELGTAEFIEICDRANVAVLELVPASRALS
jgi:hypothetical protein